MSVDSVDFTQAVEELFCCNQLTLAVFLVLIAYGP